MILQQQISSLEQRALELTADGAKVRLALARQVDVTERIQAAADRKAKRLAAMLERSQTELTAAKMTLRVQTQRHGGTEALSEGGEAEEEEPYAQVSPPRHGWLIIWHGPAVLLLSMMNCRGRRPIAAWRHDSFNSRCMRDPYSLHCRRSRQRCCLRTTPTHRSHCTASVVATAYLDLAHPPARARRSLLAARIRFARTRSRRGHWPWLQTQSGRRSSSSAAGSSRPALTPIMLPASMSMSMISILTPIRTSSSSRRLMAMAMGSRCERRTDRSGDKTIPFACTFERARHMHRSS